MNLHCRIAQTPKELDEVFSLRYTCYRGKGAIEARADQRFRDRYDGMPNQFSFLVRVPGEETRGSVRISVVKPESGWREAPSATVFGDHPAFQTIAAGSYVEASRLCFLPEAKRDVLCRLIANLVALADQHDAPWVVACPREEHSMFYQRLFGFRQLGEPRQYFGVNFRTALLGVPLEEIRQTAERFRPMKNAWQSALAGLPPAMPLAAIYA